MQITIDARYVCDHFPGIGRYTYNLLRALSCLTTGEVVSALYNPTLKNSRYDLCRLISPNLRLVETEAAPFSLNEQWQVPLLLKGTGTKVFHSPYYVGPYLSACASVVTIHDIISLHYPEYLPSLKARWGFWIAMRLAARSSKIVITDSISARDDLNRYFGVPTDRIRVIPLAADEFFEPANDSTQYDHPYVLYVGINKPHKNLPRLIRAFAKTRVEHRLVIAGSWDHRYPESRQLAEELAQGDRIKFLGPVGERGLQNLYHGASLFVFPSLAEGFGLPVLEAMACGVPVIVSNIQPLADLVGEAGILVDPLNIDEMAEAIQRVANDEQLRTELGERAQLRARDFSWRKTAELTLAAYHEAASI